jgi:hypothetical protein
MIPTFLRRADMVRVAAVAAELVRSVCTAEMADTEEMGTEGTVDMAGKD